MSFAVAPPGSPRWRSSRSASLLYALARRRRRRWAVRFPAVATVAAVAPRPSAWRRRIPAALLALAVIALVGALARPQSTVAVPIERATVIMIMDGSRSMQAVDVEPSRIAAAKARGAERSSTRSPTALRARLRRLLAVADDRAAPDDRARRRSATRSRRSWPTAAPRPARRSTPR